MPERDHYGQRPYLTADHGPFVLVVSYAHDYDPPEIFGLFATVADGQRAAELYRWTHALPPAATSENNEQWTYLGWHFAIVPLRSMRIAGRPSRTT